MNYFSQTVWDIRTYHLLQVFNAILLWMGQHSGTELILKGYVVLVISLEVSRE
jgi:hypothetical protein